MHVAGDLGFSSLVLLLSLVFPVIGFVIRRKWRVSAARKEEIKRLLILASEEAARAELEATVSYSTVSLPSNIYQCAVCYCPTTTRCARCKAVRYCTGKCQIIHWRQGHKEECQPPVDTYHNDDNTYNSAQKVAKQDRCGNASVVRSFEGPALSNCSGTHEVAHVKGNGYKVDYDEVAERISSVSESSASDASFSGFSTSPSGDESSDDVSVGESVSSKDAKGSDGQISCESVQDVLEPGLNMVDRTISISPKFACLVDSVNTSEVSAELDRSKTASSGGESRCSIGGTLEGSITQPGKVSLGFWDRTIDYVVTSNSVQNDPGLSSSSGVGNCSNSESFLHFKFDLSRSKAPLSNAQSSRVKGIQYDDSVPANSRPIDRAALSVSCGGGNTPRPRSSTFASCIKSRQDSNASKPSDLKSASSSCVHIPLSNGDVLHTVGSHSLKSDDCKPASSNFNISDGTFSDSASTSHVSRSTIPSSFSQRHVAYSVNGHVVPTVKSGKVDNVQADSLNSSHVLSSSPNSISGLKSSVRKVVDQLRGPKSGKYSDKGFFSYDLFVKLYTSNKVEMRPCGLMNCGNSCYANAVLQCLAFTPPLTAYFVQGLHSKECVNKEWCFTCEFEGLILKAKEGKTPLSPIGILSQLQNIGSHLGNGREEDAHEFLRYAIDTMQSVCLKEAGVNNALDSFEEETTLMGLTFGGYLRSKIKCMKCHYKSERHEKMMDLTVEIEGDIEKLEDALRRFTGTEILDDDNKYQCSRCKSYVKAKKKLTILEAPNVLTIALKRFQSGKFGKLNKSIRFPEILDLAPYMSGTSDKAPIYRLFGVVVHLDIMNASFSGHYVCYVKNIQNKWFKIDDSMVTPVELERVLTKGAYMLLYARCSPRAPRLIRSGIASIDPKVNNSPSRMNARNWTLNSRSTSNVAQLSPESVESFNMRFQRLQRILEEDSSSDSYSFTSSNSDEGSCSTESTRDSTSTEDLSEYIFGGWNNGWRNASDSDTCSSSSSPLYSSMHSPQTSRSGTDSVTEHGEWERQSSRVVDLEVKFLHSDTTKQCRKLDTSVSYRETDSRRLGWVNPVKSGVSFRRSMSERTD
ncbi:ubiquitin carboxyl-terminal hydrolase 17 [Euphorbia lathyris]|uniref:ubiquitin carboxyl-terminal hydrolase 17 n=1 Tax=Euphorbia lathyris TaxID=212925 RepID=UPI003313592A